MKSHTGPPGLVRQYRCEPRPDGRGYFHTDPFGSKEIGLFVSQRFDRIERGGFARWIVAKEDAHRG